MYCRTPIAQQPPYSSPYYATSSPLCGSHLLPHAIFSYFYFADLSVVFSNDFSPVKLITHGNPLRSHISFEFCHIGVCSETSYSEIAYLSLFKPTPELSLDLQLSPKPTSCNILLEWELRVLLPFPLHYLLPFLSLLVSLNSIGIFSAWFFVFVCLDCPQGIPLSRLLRPSVLALSRHAESPARAPIFLQLLIPRLFFFSFFCPSSVVLRTFATVVPCGLRWLKTWLTYLFSSGRLQSDVHYRHLFPLSSLLTINPRRGESSGFQPELSFVTPTSISFSCISHLVAFFILPCWKVGLA